MSRYSFFPKDDHDRYVTVVGWDPGMGSFFLQYGDVGSDLPLIFATGKRFAEHPGPGVVVALAHHLSIRVPADLSTQLEADRAREGNWRDDDLPEFITFTTQADDGRELAFRWPRDRCNPETIAAVADHIISGEAERDLNTGRTSSIQ
ncbi:MULTISPECIES: hypothetical protein [unclassified Novosphingobium]|uniref:hypothetical protein n=1 Tax=unclassified Novosphingobium TaxID=2644732 RepID=UPI001357C3D0|nr:MULTISPECIES: hypothetical protein [unclassified Novosphingobium]